MFKLAPEPVVMSQTAGLTPSPTIAMPPPPPGVGHLKFLEGVGLAHQLAECLAALAVVLEDRQAPRPSGGE